MVRTGSQLNGRYSDAALALFEREAAKYGTQLNEYQAKIFGGSNVLTDITPQGAALVGNTNTEAALRHLSEREILLRASHVGGTGHRQIVFDVGSGDVWVKHGSL